MNIDWVMLLISALCFLFLEYISFIDLAFLSRKLLFLHFLFTIYVSFLGFADLILALDVI